MKRAAIVCAVCGELFDPVGTQKLCSPACVRAAKTTHQRTRRAFIEYGRGTDPGRVDADARRAVRDRERSRELRRDEIAAALRSRERELMDAWRERQK